MFKFKWVLALGLAGMPLWSAAQSSDVEARDNRATYIVTYSDPGLLKVQRTASRSAGQRKFDVDSPEVSAHRALLEQRQAALFDAISDRIGRAPTQKHAYFVARSGVALQLTEAEATQIASVPGVAKVQKELIYDMTTFRGPTYIGANTIWDGSGTPTGAAGATRGQGMKIGLFDSGSNVDHPSYAPMGAECGYSTPEPKLFAFDCGQSQCAGGTPNDDASGHGSHTSSTAGGNTVPTTANPAPPIGISGVASCAKLYTYKVCTPTCAGSNIAAAVDKAILDGVDVVNISLGPNINGALDPWANDGDTLEMMNADILVAMSAGNTRTAPTQPTQPIGEVKNVGPWVLTVANSSHDAINKNRVDVAGGPQNVYGLKGTGPNFAGNLVGQIADSSDLGNVEGCTASGGFAAGSMTGRIALIRRGTCGFLEKVNNATTAGAIGAIIYNNVVGFPIVMGAQEASTIPSVMVSQADGQAISTFLDSNATAQGTVSGTTVLELLPAAGGVINSGSLRGPLALFDVTKPDITAPGTNIFAAYKDPEQYSFLSGTSMSSPHVAGAAALVRKVQPTWTPMEVHSALMLTANGTQTRENATTPADANDVGSGMVDLTKAAKLGVVLPETYDNMLRANPASGGNPRRLNIASVRNTACQDSCYFIRTLRNTSTTATSWTAAATMTNAPGVTVRVFPTSFSFSGGLGETREVAIVVDIASGTTVTAPVFGQVTFTENGSLSPPARMTVNIRGSGTGQRVFADGAEGGN